MSEPIAIIGMACRFARGIDSPEKFWALLRDGADTITELPAGRWDWYAGKGPEHAAAVRGVTSRGAYLDDVAGFDADFFGIAPREARLMDPQQRITLELAWEALEHAGISPLSLAGSDTGIFTGVGADDYGRRMLEDLPGVQAWSGIGGAYCGVPNRVSYLLDLRGPSVAVDTACSSSLVAIHLAGRALSADECPLALAGGVLVMAAPGLSLVLDAAGAIAPDGRCKPFDRDADGYGRGEGGAVVVLKRLSDARRDGDEVLAVIVGSAVHQDGKTNGIMAPSDGAQAHLFRRACAQARIAPSAVSFVEAHGTGTRLGDPVEARALAAVYGKGRSPDRPLLVGSVKPNIGHLEAAAGVAGVIKTVLALRHGEIPPTLNLVVPNPAIPWDTAGLRVVTELTPWQAGKGGQAGGRAGQESLVTATAGRSRTSSWRKATRLPAPPARMRAWRCTRSPAPAWRRSASTPGGSPIASAPIVPVPIAPVPIASVPASAGPPIGTADAGYTLAVRRAHLPHRACVLAADREQLISRLRELGRTNSGPVAGTATGSVLPLAAAGRGLVWVFSGQGSQWTGMGRELAAADPAFSAVIDELDPVFAAELGCSIRALLAARQPLPVDLAQPAIFAVQVALAATWRSCGLAPAAVLGHSVGEIAAAVVAGILTLEQGGRLVCRRSLLLRRVAGQGAMLMASLAEEAAERRIAGLPGLAVAVAAAPRSTVISGGVAEIRDLARQWRADGIMVRPVDSDVAFHGPQMDPLLGPLADAAAGLPPARPVIDVYSTALADPRSGQPRDGAYWAANLRGRVRFAQAVAAAAADGYRLFTEVSPHPVVAHSILETLADLGIDDSCVTHSLRRRRPERETLLASLGLLYCHGAEVRWPALWPRGRLADLPPTAWQHRPYWLDDAPAATPAGGHDPASHTLLGARTSVNGMTPATVWQTLLDRSRRPYPGDHPVHGVEIVPAAVLLCTFLAAARASPGGSGPWPDLADVALRVPVTVTRPREIQVAVQDGTIRLSSRVAEGAADHGWVTHTTAAIEARTDLGQQAEPGAAPTGVAEQAAPGSAGPPGIAERLASIGVAAMGFAWEADELSCGDGLMTVAVRAGGDHDEAPVTWAPVLDAVLSAASLAFSGTPVLRMPAHLQRLTLAERPPSSARVTVRTISEDTVDVVITDGAGAAIGKLTRLRYGTLDGDTGVLASPRRLVHELTWQPPFANDAGAGPDAGAKPDVTLVGPGSALLDAVHGGLVAAGFACRTVAGPEELSGAELSGGRMIAVVAPRGQDGSEAETAASASWLLTRAAQRLTSAGLAGSGLAGSGLAGAGLAGAGLAGAGLISPARLWCVTQGVLESARRRDLGHACLWGLGRVIGGEHPEFWGGIIDLGRSPADLEKLGDVLRTVRGEDVVVVRDGGPSVARLRRIEGEPVKPPLTCRPDGTYLITGGLGSLGLQVARWLADRARGASCWLAGAPCPRASSGT